MQRKLFRLLFIDNKHVDSLYYVLKYSIKYEGVNDFQGNVNSGDGGIKGTKK